MGLPHPNPRWPFILAASNRVFWVFPNEKGNMGLPHPNPRWPFVLAASMGYSGFFPQSFKDDGLLSLRSRMAVRDRKNGCKTLVPSPRSE